MVFSFLNVGVTNVDNFRESMMHRIIRYDVDSKYYVQEISNYLAEVYAAILHKTQHM